MRCASLLQALSRFAVSAWVGAAALFVVTGVREVTSDEIPPVIRNTLTTLRFPAYYAFGFTLVAATLVLLTLAVASVPADRRRQTGQTSRSLFTSTLLLLALVLMGFDYVMIYGPLEAMMTAREVAIPSSFHHLHQWSKWINAASISLCLLAALRLCLPQPMFESASSSDPKADANAGG